MKAKSFLVLNKGRYKTKSGYTRKQKEQKCQQKHLNQKKLTKSNQKLKGSGCYYHRL